jgi:hypothetical protein
MENFDIFNLSIDNFKSEEKQVQKSNEYKTDPKSSKDSIYRSIVRFIPNIKDPKKSIIKKFSYWLEGNDGEGFYVDCPSSINEKSIIQDTFWKLFKSESAFDKKQSERIKRKEYYYSYVEIVKDPQNPELEGTIQIFRYPKAVKKLIDSQLQPEATEIEMGAEPVNVFDFFEGKDFSIKVTLKGGYWNYDECKFASSKSPITVKGSKMENNAECRKQILAMYEGLQPLEGYEFKPWNDDQRERVFKFISDLTGSNPGNAYANTTNYSKPSPPPVESPKAEKTETDKRIDAFENASKDSAKAADNDIEDWLKEFDIK